MTDDRLHVVDEAIEQQSLCCFFEDKVVAGLPHPRYCTSEDLVSAFRTQMVSSIAVAEPIGAAEFDEVYERFMLAVDAFCGEEHVSEPIPIVTSGLAKGAAVNPVRFWGGGSFLTADRFRVWVVGSLPYMYDPACEDPGSCASRCVYVSICATCTKDAFRKLTEELPAVLRVLFSSDVLVNWNGWPEDFGVAPALIDMYFSNVKTKDSIDRRIRNAIQLLIDADSNCSRGVSIALNVAALEALLGERTDSIAGSLADSTAVLLEPDLNYRSRAVRHIKQLYHIRSRVLHGQQLEGEVGILSDARQVVSGAMRAIVERCQFMRRIDQTPERPSDLLKELKESKFGGGPPAGVSESSVTGLWRHAP
ncbi:MAG: hypothetical protein GY842_13275 [bacterium]|nr:hypothetical protein [bacterium]